MSKAVLRKQYETLPDTSSPTPPSTDDDAPISVAGMHAEFTVEEAVESIGLGWFQLKIYLVCGLFSATDALEMLLLSVLSPELRCEWMLPEWKVAVITTVCIVL